MVISPDENVGSRMRFQEVSFLKQAGVGLNRAIEQANRLAMQKHARSITTILADIPLVEPRDFKELLSISAAVPRVVMAPSLKGGTNMMLTSPPGAISPSYGRWSYSKHLRLAQMNGVNAYSISNSRVSFDIDTASDLMELGRLDPEGKTASARATSMMKPVMNVARTQ
jgi:2-phospho-L-lactate guanylyltransferase